ncbi:MAG: hypothetical protein AAB412_00760 [Elusimicrobiota bacterium]
MSAPAALPRGLWIGTGVFAALSAAGVYYGIGFGRDAYQRSSDARMESSAVNSPRADTSAPVPAGQAGLRAGAAQPPVQEGAQRDAAAHWDAGLAAFQKGNLPTARDEWTLCAQIDPAQADCRNGLERLDKMGNEQKEAPDGTAEIPRTSGSPRGNR